MFYRTDVEIAKGIWASRTALSPKYLERTLLICKIIQVTYPAYRKLLKVGSKQIFRIAPLRSYVGKYYSLPNLIEIDVRSTPESTLVTLAHELVHAEQFHQKRLAVKKVKCKKSRKLQWTFFWHGEPTNTTYWNMPWEVEARNRQSVLAQQILEMVYEKI
jgi:hypothetical protein